MGGCRCTYKNCNVKSDGKTHMFHFPVFEKVRCYQWLVNSRRLDFLNLTVSQLKNRCVCQHHFLNECFMNYKKDKLTFDAVPTLNGPYCDTSKFVEPEEPKEYPVPILLEDIENEFDVNDKKSIYSMKYGDFLTNNEFVDARYNPKNINLNKVIATGINLNSSSFIKGKDKIVTEPYNLRYSLPTRKVKEATVQPMLVVPPYSDLSNELKLGKELNLEQNINNFHTNLSLNLEDNSAVPRNSYVIESVSTASTACNSNQDFIKIAPKVKILSEKKIEDPINIGLIAGKFEKISPSHPLTLPDKGYIPKKEPLFTHNYNTLKVESVCKPSNKLKILEVLNAEFDPLPSKDEQVQGNQILDITERIQSPTKKSTQIKNKVTPERSAVIEKKRKFNMRLKDIIESCLDKLDEPGKHCEISQNPTNLENSTNICVNEENMALENNIIKPKENKLIQAEDKTLPSVQDSTIAYLEQRMKKMESTLLNKIAQNSQEIVDFKKKWTKDASQHRKKREHRDNKRCVSTQTHQSESSYKMFLYQEISKFLSPSVNCTIYEELFLNKYSCEQMKSPSKRKRRKCL
ncbi:uncharacterized protein LOC112049252 isoform X2 [Bicyclus anynana]|nr:uncharacterized protein LOC112049252 isoform X2 [Bicyclus anynana]XP_052741299.1 uncharacterized protein LOC112049252 isoform X2 [Bicyclus anynana]XP_052741300.1 uncharacterized protein LOC112049252 isoform X2 [Bicyclus anynana]